MKDGYFTSTEFRSQLMQVGNSPVARLKRLSTLLKMWNQQRADRPGETAELSMTDIHILKEIIHNETSRIKLKNTEIVSDQILFLFIGAMKHQIQNQSARPWEVVDQSIRNFTMQKKSIGTPLLALLFLSMLAVGVLSNGRVIDRPNTSPYVFNADRVITAHASGSATVRNLLRLYTSMKEGHCQLPQAAMLQPQDRAAFIAFINAGEVNVGTAANLKNALTYVQCLYPQKLMDTPLNDSVAADREYI